MPYWHFQIANFVSAFIWSAVLLVFGDVASRLIEWVWSLL
jgi:membrane protein DedA with SNARE-associated domain